MLLDLSGPASMTSPVLRTSAFLVGLPAPLTHVSSLTVTVLGPLDPSTLPCRPRRWRWLPFRSPSLQSIQLLRIEHFDRIDCFRFVLALAGISCL